MKATTTIAIAPAQIVELPTSPLNAGMMTWSVTRPSTTVPNTDVSAKTTEPVTEVAKGAGCATMNRRKVATPRRHRLRSVVSGTCGYLFGIDRRGYRFGSPSLHSFLPDAQIVFPREFRSERRCERVHRGRTRP